MLSNNSTLEITQDTTQELTGSIGVTELTRVIFHMVSSYQILNSLQANIDDVHASRTAN